VQHPAGAPSQHRGTGLNAGVDEVLAPELVLEDRDDSIALGVAAERELVRCGQLARFLAEARRYSRLSDEEERRLAHAARQGDSSAAQRLVLHNLGLVVAIALRYQRAWNPLLDLIQEGTIGLLEAVRRWESSSGARFGTYAAYWIRACILQFIMTNSRLVSIAHTRAGRKLFFRLEKERRKLLEDGFDVTPKLLAARLDVPESEVTALAPHIDAPEVSVDAPLRDEGPALVDGLARPEPSPEEIAAENEFRNVVGRLMDGFARTLADERERAVWTEHFATEEPVPLSILGKRYGLSKQRMGQIANRLKQRFRDQLIATFGADARISWLHKRPGVRSPLQPDGARFRERGAADDRLELRGPDAGRGRRRDRRGHHRSDGSPRP
jgi:RNA polymerase sigma-32 factor